MDFGSWPGRTEPGPSHSRLRSIGHILETPFGGDPESQGPPVISLLVASLAERLENRLQSCKFHLSICQSCSTQVFCLSECSRARARKAGIEEYCKKMGFSNGQWNDPGRNQRGMEQAPTSADSSHIASSHSMGFALSCSVQRPWSSGCSTDRLWAAQDRQEGLGTVRAAPVPDLSAQPTCSTLFQPPSIPGRVLHLFAQSV